MGKAFQLKFDDNGIAWLTFDLPGEKVNKFSKPVMEELDKTLIRLSNEANVKALVITSPKPGIFIAGADLEELGAITSVEDGEKLARDGQGVFNKLEKLPFPTIAVIDGACVGGGLELALCCTYRIATDNPKTRLGLPEVTLGLVPGWGGTQRLPRLIGLQKGLEMVVSGKLVDGRKAYKLGIVDHLVAPEFLDLGIQAFLELIFNPKEKKKIQLRRKPSGAMPWLLEKNPLGRALMFSMAKKGILEKTKGHYPAPLKALEVVKNTATTSLESGLQAEAKAISGVADGTICKNLIGLFFTSEALKKEPGRKLHAKSRDLSEIGKIGVLGAGIMGGGITWLFARKGHQVVMKDISWDAVAKGYEAANTIFQKLLKIRKAKPHEVAMGMHRIHGTLDEQALRDCDVVIEAVVENMEIKKQVLAEVEKVVAPETIICSNTSSLSITEMAEGMKHPERFVGMHFFNPVNRMPLVEIIPGEKTSEETIATIVKITQKLGKTPLVVKNVAGFLVNRILIPVLNEAGWLLQEGADMERVDKIGLAFGLPMGPFVLADEVGIDVGTKVSQYLEGVYGQRMKMPEVFNKMCENKWFGKKNGKGFYSHVGKKRTPNSAVKTLVPRSNKGTISDEEILDRLILVMLNEAAKCLEEEVVSKANYLDMGMIMGTGYPPFRGGLLKYADDEGIDSIVTRLENLAKKCGERFYPAELLLQMRESGEKFYSKKVRGTREQDNRSGDAREAVRAGG